MTQRCFEDPPFMHYNILHMVCEVVSNPLHKVDIQINGLQFFNQSFVEHAESNALVKSKNTAAASILHHLHAVSHL